MGTAAELAALIRGRGPVVVLTGAGMSTESGIPDFGSVLDAEPNAWGRQSRRPCSRRTLAGEPIEVVPDVVLDLGEATTDAAPALNAAQSGNDVEYFSNGACTPRRSGASWRRSSRGCDRAAR